jgi:hypothetical protein
VGEATRRALGAIGIVALGLGAAGADAKTRHKEPPVVTVHVLTLTQQEARGSGSLRVELKARRVADVRVRGFVRTGGSGDHASLTVVAPTREVHLERGKALNYALPLSAAGRRRFARDCHTIAVTVAARAHGEGHRRPGTSTRWVPSTKPCPGSGSGGGHKPPHGKPPHGLPLTYTVGLASRSINPGPDGKWNGANVYLGGYGISGGQPGGLDQGRAANGILAGGPHVTAFALSDGKHPFAFANIEVQGWFVANKDAPYGLVDMRKDVARRTGGALRADQVMIQSDHSHGGADPMGVWGNVPLSFRKFMYDQTVAAIVDAWSHRTPANLYYGWAPARDLQSNQFDYDESNKVMDSDLRVLQARKSDGKPIATILDFSSHPTVLGSSNQHITGDWPQAANAAMARRFGGKAMTIVGTLGRTQPADRACPTSTKPDSDPGEAACKLDHYAGRVLDRVAQALANATLLSGEPSISSKTYLIQDPADNGVVYIGLGVAGDPIGVKLDRALTPPWLQGNVLGTVTGSVRIGDVLLSTVPGEIYPQIALKVADSVKDGSVRPHGFMLAGLAGDQLGYIIYPYQSYSEPILSTFVSRGDQVPSPDPIGNDNYAFNVSKTLGARVTCSLLRGAGEVFGKGSSYRAADPECVQFPNDTLFAEGSDVTFPAP